MLHLRTMNNSDHTIAAPSHRRPRLLDQVRSELRTRHYAIRTEETYIGWIKRFLHYSNMRHPRDMGAQEINQFLSHLALVDRVSASTQRQALSALLFLYRDVFKMELPWIDQIVRARQPRRLPTVLGREEAARILSHLDGVNKLVVLLLYGTGMRILECLRLRAKDVDFELSHLRIYNAKGHKDRVTMLPDSTRDLLKEHLREVRKIHEQDLAEGFGDVYMPGALDRKFPQAAQDWKWQYVFPAAGRSRDPRSGRVRRHHIHETVVRKAIRNAARRAGISKRVSCHTFRHSFATHLLMAGYDIRTIQELLGHKDVKTTMIYTHILNCSGGRGVVSPADSLHKAEFTTGGG